MYINKTVYTWTPTILQHRRCIISQNVNTDSALEDGRNYRPKRVELVEVINKASLLNLAGCLYYFINYEMSHKHQIQKTDYPEY